MECLACNELLTAFSSATVDYFTAVSNLAKVAGAYGNNGSFSDAFERVRQNYEKCERAREDVQQHLSGHYPSREPKSERPAPRRLGERTRASSQR